jgi:hypothetical protein
MPQLWQVVDCLSPSPYLENGPLWARNNTNNTKEDTQHEHEPGGCFGGAILRLADATGNRKTPALCARWIRHLRIGRGRRDPLLVGLRRALGRRRRRAGAA